MGSQSYVLLQSSMMTWRSLQPYLLIPLVVVQGSLDDCGDFSVGRCQPSQDTIVGIQHLPCHNLSLTTCAAMCQKICKAEATCDFFSYNASTCVLLREREHNGYYAECGLLAGASTPSMFECDQQLPVDDCRRFVFENCDYKGTEVYAERDVTNAADCQTLLMEIGEYYGAELFLHDTHQFNLCSFLSSRERECMAVNGPVHPSFEECFAGPTTTTGPTQSTTTGYDQVTVRFIARDATTNRALARVVICVPFFDCILTDDQGQAHIPLTGVEFPFNLVFSAAKTGYETYNSTVRIRNNEPEQIVAFSLSPILTPDQNYRLVMTWGPQPRDLDLHVIEFYDNYQCETYYSNKNGCYGLSLDVDNTQGGDNGAETITWSDYQGKSSKQLIKELNKSKNHLVEKKDLKTRSAASTTTTAITTSITTTTATTPTTSKPQQLYNYPMFVYKYAGNLDLVNSQAELRLYNGNGTVMQYDVPTSNPNSTDRYWVLGCFDGRFGLDSLQVIDALVQDKPTPWSLCNL